MAEGKLTPKQVRFVEEYLVDYNATQAAIRAGYSEKNAGKIGPELLGKTRIADAIRTRTEARTQRMEVSADRIIRELALIALGDVRELFKDGLVKSVNDLTAEQAALISSLEVTDEIRGEERILVGHKTKFKRWDKVKALELLARINGMFKDRLDVVTQTKPSEETLTDAELADRIRSLEERARASQARAEQEKGTQPPV